MAVEVRSCSITRKDYDNLKSKFYRSYLQLLPDYLLHNLEIVELFLTEKELLDIQEYLDIVQVDD